ncbi:leucine zipper domain-containing protein [Rhodococcus sp. PvR044]|uniref:leucine zipper domain-containing protein n=1 Tax=Rhodococcus sp. PvR044 TaxID=3156402 RepID=UPI0033990C13
MVRANATLTPKGRLLLAQRIFDNGWPIIRAAEHFNVSWPTAHRPSPTAHRQTVGGPLRSDGRRRNGPY